MKVPEWLQRYWPEIVSTGLSGSPLFGALGKGIGSLVNAAGTGYLDPEYANSSINDFNSAMSQDKLGYTEGGIAFDRTNPDSMINAQNLEYAYKRDDTAVDRLFEAYKRVGINPALAFSNSAGTTMASSATSGHYSQNANEQMNSALKAGGLLAIIIKLLASL